MSEPWGPVVTFLVAAGVARVVQTTLHDVKFAGTDTAPGLAADDRILAALGCAALAVAAAIGMPLGALGSLACALVALVLWADAGMYRSFTIELGASHGVGALVLPTLWRELTGTAHARAFLSGHPAFCATPPIAAAGFAASLSAPGVVAVLVIGALGVVARAADRASRPFARSGVAACAAAFAARSTGEPWLLALSVAALWWGSLRAPPGDPRPHLAAFFRPRPIRAAPSFTPRAEHAALLDVRPRTPPRSARFGAVAGRDVLLLSFESLARDHLSTHHENGARMPLVEGLLARGVSSRAHFVPTTMTNDAHVAWYAGHYTSSGGPPRSTHDAGGALPALQAAGYRCVYATTADAAFYGLAGILADARFDLVVDATSLRRTHGEVLADAALVERLPPVLSSRRADRPHLFLHVHTADSHVPYIVHDRARFGRFDQDDDEGRFKNALEESDATMTALLDALLRAGVLRDPLVVVTGDHGQAFGQMGYRSHGSGLVKEQVLVPFVVAHDALAPETVPFSSHFDVLPTILDLVGVAHPPTLGASIFAERSPPALALTAGRPSVSTTSCFGYVLPDEKVMVDLVLDRVTATDWDDRAPRALRGLERDYAASLAAAAFRTTGLQ